MEIRPLTDDERNYLKGFYGETPRNLYTIGLNLLFPILVIASLVFYVTDATAYYIIMPLLDGVWTEDHKKYLIIISIFVAFLMIQGEVRSVIKLRRQTNRKLRDILAHNQAEIYSLSIRRAAELEEYEDEGVGFFLEIDDDNVLFLRGQDLYEFSSDIDEQKLKSSEIKPYGEVFPSTKVTLIRETTTGIRLNLISSGEKITGVLKLANNDFLNKIKGNTEYIGPEDGSFYKGSLESVIASFSIELK